MNTQIQQMTDADAIQTAAKAGKDWLLYIETQTLGLKAVSNAGVVYRADTSGATLVFITP